MNALCERIVNAETRTELVAAARALDRVVMWSEIVIPHWYKGRHNIAYWNKYDRPATKPPYDLGVLDTWWFNPRKAKFIDAGEAPPAAGSVRQ